LSKFSRKTNKTCEPIEFRYVPKKLELPPKRDEVLGGVKRGYHGYSLDLTSKSLFTLTFLLGTKFEKSSFLQNVYF